MPSENLSGGRLYVVATPIGNCSDWSERAVEVLRCCQGVACEDTRVTRHLLDRFHIALPMISYRDENEQAKAPFLIKKIKDGENWALVCDAGTPTICDPGFRLVRECKREAIPVLPIPGPCASLAALSVSGLPTNGFLFLGFLPNRPVARQKILGKYKDFEYTLIFYESCHRIEKTLADVVEIFGPGRTLCLAREITKWHETILTDHAIVIQAALKKQSIKGEFVLLIAPQGYDL